MVKWARTNALTMAKQDLLQQAKEAYSDAQDAIREQKERFREDLKFSNPADPQQWDDFSKTARRGRPMLTLDRTNQFIAQIVNDARQNKPSIQVLPADSRADIEVAKRLNGIIRHIEYVSRAGIAYDMALELAARVGQGWLRVLPKVVRSETNEQEIIIQRVHDPMAICLDPNAMEPDGSDAMYGFVETTLTNKAFERRYPKAKKADWDSEGWFSDDGVRIAEYFKVVEEKQNRIAIAGPDGGRMTVTEGEYWELSAKIGYRPPVQVQIEAVKRTVKWCHMTGAEILEETEFPSYWVPLIPVLGYELWVEGKRYLCGMVRRMMDGQRLHNYEASAITEAMMVQPKAPFLISERALSGHEDQWKALNSGNPSHLPYNDLDEDNNTPIQPPIRLAPPAFPLSFTNGNTRGSQEMEASVGMNKSSLGMPSNAVSGRAKLADQREGDTANYHYIDNLRRSMEHMGRIIVNMIPQIYDTRRQAKILGEDGEQSAIEVDPTMDQAVKKKDGKVIAINPSVGAYDVRVKIGPAFATVREEASQRLTELSAGNPALGAAMAPLIIKMNDMPEADKISRVAIALLPPNVQAIYNEDENADIPPGVKSQMDAQAQQIQQLAGAAEQATEVIKDLQEQLDAKNTAVQDQVKIAMSEIKAAKADLDAQASEIDHKRQMLAKDAKIAQLELQFEDLGNTVKLAESARAQQETDAQETEKAEPKTDALAKVLEQSQRAVVEALKQNTATLAQLQGLTVDAIEDMADAIAATRMITVQKSVNGGPTVATSVAIMADKESDDE